MSENSMSVAAPLLWHAGGQLGITFHEKGKMIQSIWRTPQERLNISSHIRDVLVSLPENHH